MAVIAASSVQRSAAVAWTIGAGVCREIHSSTEVRSEEVIKMGGDPTANL